MKWPPGLNNAKHNLWTARFGALKGLPFLRESGAGSPHP